MSNQMLPIGADLPKSLYTQSYIDLFGCSHRMKISYQEKLFCQTCGIFLNNNQTRVFKTLQMKYNAFFNPMKILQFTLTGQNQLINSDNIDNCIQRVKVIDFIISVAERLRISMNTIFLAVNFLDNYISQNSLSESQVYLYAATSLMLAAKSIELDERIPFISKLKRYVSMTTHPEVNLFKTEDFRHAERKLIQCMQWHLQKVTLIDRVEQLLAFGVIFDDDEIENEEIQQISKLEELKIFNLVKEIESNYQDVCLTILKGQYQLQDILLDKLFSLYDEVTLSMAIIGYLRKSIKLSNIWSQQLQQLTSIPGDDLNTVASSIKNIMSNSPKVFKKQIANKIEQTVLPTPKTNLPLNNYNSNNQVKKLHFDHGQNKPAIFSSSSNLEKGIAKHRTNKNHFTYLNFNENHHISYLQEVEKKYESKLAKYLNDPSHLVTVKMKMFPGH